MSIRTEKKDRVISLTWERPPLNVMDLALLRDLDTELDGCAMDSTAHVVVLSGAGERAFSAGVDIKDHTRQKAAEMLEIVHGTIRKLLALPQVTIARVRGICFGGGCELATCCDFIMASESSSFGTPEILVGCYPPVALARFSSLIGYRRAADLILTGRTLPAQEALAMGLISRVAPQDRLDEAVTALLDELLGKSGAVLRTTVKGLRELSLRSFGEALQRSEQLYRDELLQTEDVEEGVRAFLEKRRPRWTHR
jgi:cyclohexa-1,5-dienecarbonyl-CoA hydratase